MTLEKTNNIEMVKSTDELKAIMDKVLMLAEENGATAASVCVNHDCGFSVDIRMQQTENITFSEDEAITVNVYLGHRKGNASTTDSSIEALRATVIRALEIAKISSEDEAFGLAEKKLMAKNLSSLDLYHIWNINPTKAIELAKECEKKALDIDSRIVNSDGTNVSTVEMSQGYANSHGFSGVVKSTQHSLSCSLIAKENGIMQREYEYTLARDPDLLLSVDKIAKNAADFTLERLGGRKIKTQKVAVLFSSRLSAGLIGTFINAISGFNLYRGNSFLLDSLGKKIFPENITIREQPYLKGGLGSASFDCEGVATRNNIFVQNGILEQYVLGSYSARKLGFKTTANSGGVYNLLVEPTLVDKSLLQEMQRGILVTELMGQGINILTGDYSRGAVGFWVEDGVIQYPVEEITIAGNLKNMLLNIRAVGNDINPNFATRCGSILIDEMMVGGN